MNQQTSQNQNFNKEENLKQTLEGLLVLDNVQLALISGVIAGMKLERQIQNDGNEAF
ncbi:hypothetical protein [Lysinibacillus sp. NPDC096212]|uniref:hypothetical protein n=1 Tax=Lysinibacillus sp. NPDC096212 TaxID=3364135 RepID=UPI0037F2D13C